LSLHGGGHSALIASDQGGVLVVKGMESAGLLVQEGVVLTNKDQANVLRSKLGVVFLLLLFSGWSGCSSGRSSGSHDKSCLILLFPVVCNLLEWIFTMNKQNEKKEGQ